MTEKGKVNVEALRKKLNKTIGKKLVWDLEDEDCPTEVYEWIRSGSFILDCNTNKEDIGGWPIGKICELAGLEGTGKSFLAALALGEAQKAGYTGVYFDSESSLSNKHLKNLGVNTKEMIYVQAETIELVFTVINTLLEDGNKYFFVWDSYANTATGHQVEADDFNPTSSIALAARINAGAMKKLVIPMANSQSTLLVINQLRTNIGARPWEDQYITPGGKSLAYAYSMRVWLTKPFAKKSFLYDDDGLKMGSTVRAEIKKSRFGTEGRRCEFQIAWGDEEVGILDEESWFLALLNAGIIETRGSWRVFPLYDEPDFKFRTADWKKLCREREDVRMVAKDMLKDSYIKNYSYEKAHKMLTQDEGTDSK